MSGADTPERASDYHFGGDRVKEVLYDSEVILRLVDDQLQELCEKLSAHSSHLVAPELFTQQIDASPFCGSDDPFFPTVDSLSGSGSWYLRSGIAVPGFIFQDALSSIDFAP